MILEVFTRVFVDADALDTTCAFYQDLLGGEQSLRFVYTEMGLELAQISSPRLSVLIIAGPPPRKARSDCTKPHNPI